MKTARTFLLVMVALVVFGANAHAQYRYDVWARGSLGKDFIFPEDVARFYGLRYSQAQLEHFAKTIPSRQILVELDRNGYGLVAGPPNPMNLLEIRSINPTILKQTWFDRESFAKNDRAFPEWIAIRKEPVPDSTNKDWPEQLRLLKTDERVPNVAEAAWFAAVFYELRGIQLFKFTSVRTSSVDSGGYRVLVGYFDSDGLVVDDLWGDDRYDGIGVSAARKSE